ncbi:MAG TPA: phenylalanine--tRNA ligase subunit beta [Streptosporangiaceae bacterium]|nr:phenylalanine--tRNA ligase subunit beta [Streptosporangiaceae bacterium]
MLVPLSWLLEYAPLPEPVDPAAVARKLTGVGLEIEGLEYVGQDVSGLVVARVLEIEELAGHKKPIRYCRVLTGEQPDEQRWVICGATNFAVGDLVALALPGAKLPGGVEIGARKAYGKLSDGMICSAAEMAIGDDHSGILVLPADAPLGADFVSYAGLADVVLDVNVTPDKGHALSVRGMARELASAFEVPYTDPAGELAGGDAPGSEVYPASIGDPAACDRFALREVRGIDPSAPTPLAMRVRLARAGMRSVSLAVDVTNYLMLELGQPLHAFDRSRLDGPIVVRRARAGEKLETLDHVVRELDPDDILITDSSGPISMAGTMGGLATEISSDSTDMVIEAAHFSAPGTARMSRRHRLFSEASARFERGVDYELPLRASAKAVVMLAKLGGGTAVAGYTLAKAPITPVEITIAADLPDRVAGLSYGAETVIARLREVGCTVTVAGDQLTVMPPSWRPDLTDPNDLAEEVIRLEGYDKVGIAMPRAVAGHGRTSAQRLRISVGQALAGAGYVEVISSPFGSAADFDRLGLPAGDRRRSAVRLANPIRDEEPLMRSTLLPGLFRVVGRNTGRGFSDLALFEVGHAFLAKDGGPPVAPILAVDRAPTEEEQARLNAALPDQPRLAACVLTGKIELPGWWGEGRQASFYDAIEAAHLVLRESRVAYQVRAGQRQPWHPGRCAEFVISPESGSGSASGPGSEELIVGHAGELHPRVIGAFRLAPRTSAMELDLSVIERTAAGLPPVQAPVVSGYPVATQDVALVVDEEVAAAEVEAALVAGAGSAGAGSAGAGSADGGESGGSLLEDVRLFDVYTGEQTGAGRKSLAYTLRFRASDRTLTDDEVAVARDAAVAEATRRTGAVLRSG